MLAKLTPAEYQFKYRTRPLVEDSVKRKAIIHNTDIRLFTNDTISQEGEDKEILEEEFLQKQQKKVKPKR